MGREVWKSAGHWMGIWQTSTGELRSTGCGRVVRRKSKLQMAPPVWSFRDGGRRLARCLLSHPTVVVCPVDNSKAKTFLWGPYHQCLDGLVKPTLCCLLYPDVMQNTSIPLTLLSGLELGLNRWNTTNLNLCQLRGSNLMIFSWRRWKGKILKKTVFLGIFLIYQMKVEDICKGRFLWGRKKRLVFFFFFFPSCFYLKARLFSECANWKQIG